MAADQNVSIFSSQSGILSTALDRLHERARVRIENTSGMKLLPAVFCSEPQWRENPRVHPVPLNSPPAPGIRTPAIRTDGFSYEAIIALHRTLYRIPLLFRCSSGFPSPRHHKHFSDHSDFRILHHERRRCPPSRRLDERFPRTSA